MDNDSGVGLERWAADFEAFVGRFAGAFGRREPRGQARKYLRGLLAPVERKNGWQLAEIVGDADPDATQRLLYSAGWDADIARDVLQAFVSERFGDDEGIGLVDESGFLKQGRHSAGVKRQYSGTAGKTANCQVGVFLGYAGRDGHAFLDRRLFLPEDWSQDRARCEAAKIPAEVVHQPKAKLALAMLEHAWANGVPMRWVTADEAYGDAGYFRAGIAAAGKRYVVAVSSSCPVWNLRPTVRLPERRTRGRPPTRSRVAEGQPRWETVQALVSKWSPRRWRRLPVGSSEKGFIAYDWARLRVVERRDELPGDDVWLLARRSVSDPTEVAYFLSNAPPATPLKELVRVAASRSAIEQLFEEAKGEVGLDQYEVRYWHSWYRHITLSMMAHAWLASIRQQSGEKTTGSGLGRVERAGSAATAGDRAPTARPLGRFHPHLVTLAAPETPAGSTLPLPSPRQAVA
jgi:SRSO17 transposase